MLYRAMKRDDARGHPMIVKDSTSSRGLGVRRSDLREPGEQYDIEVVNGVVYPGVGGLSVGINDLEALGDRLPHELGGPREARDPAWAVEEARLPLGLKLREDPRRRGHGYVEPRVEMPIEVYEQAIWATKLDWMRIMTGKKP